MTDSSHSTPLSLGHPRRDFWDHPGHDAASPHAERLDQYSVHFYCTCNRQGRTCRARSCRAHQPLPAQGGPNSLLPPTFTPVAPHRLQDWAAAAHPQTSDTREDHSQTAAAPLSPKQDRKKEAVQARELPGDLVSERHNAHLISCRSFIHSSNTCFDSAS